MQISRFLAVWRSFTAILAIRPKICRVLDTIHDHLNKNNYLKITDRKKDIIVNLGGDNISPSKIENILCLNEFIKQSFVYGDKKNYLVGIIVADKETSKDKIKLIIENINKDLTLIEKIKKFILFHEEFTVENGMLTPTLKLKRKEIIKNYKQQLENLY